MMEAFLCFWFVFCGGGDGWGRGWSCVGGGVGIGGCFVEGCGVGSCSCDDRWEDVAGLLGFW